MEPFRLKMKIGPHEFEAEGDEASVKEQFALWRELIASPSATAPPALPSPPPAQPPAQPSLGALFESLTAPPSPQNGDITRAEYDRVFHHDGRVISLTVLPNGEGREADAALLLLLGQKVYNGTDLVTGQQISDGLKQSGLNVERVDRSWGPHLDSNVLRSGTRRGVKYRLTHPGMARAKQIAKELLQLVP